MVAVPGGATAPVIGDISNRIFWDVGAALFVSVQVTVPAVVLRKNIYISMI